MTTSYLNTGNFSLYRIGEAATNLRAMLTIAVTLIVYSLLLSGSTGAPAILALGIWLVLTFGLLYGVSIAGLFLTDQARNQEPRPWGDSFSQALPAAGRMVVAYLAVPVIILGFYVITALVAVITKIPFLGPLLLAIAHPTLVILGGLVTLAVLLAFVVIGPASWSGLSLLPYLKRVYEVARHRLVPLGIGAIALYVLALVAFGLAFGIIVFNFASVTYVFAQIVGAAGLQPDLLIPSGPELSPGGRHSSISSSGGSSGHGNALFVSSILIMAIIQATLTTIFTYGTVLLYHNLTESMDTRQSAGDTEAQPAPQEE